MKIKDFWFILGMVLFFAPFFIFDSVYESYKTFNAEHGMVMSFIKFAILATLGESIGLRIKEGKYNYKGFGLIPRAIVWGFIGISIKAAFIIFSSGSMALLEYLGMENIKAIMGADLSWSKVLVAFTSSATINLIFAPVFMTFHKITDTHILDNGGTIRGLFRPIKFKEIFPSLNWEVQWGFVFKKTIPFFWIPAHTITFCLPPEWQILFAAFLGIVLGVILSVASRMN